MVEKINGQAEPNEALSGDLDFWTVQTTVELIPTGIVGAIERVNPEGKFPFEFKGMVFETVDAYNVARELQRTFDVLIETVSMRAQPVILGQVTVATESAPVEGLPVTNELEPDSDIDIYTIRFAIEHTGAWDSDQVDMSMAKALNGLDQFVFDEDSPEANNIHIYKNELL